MHKAETLFGSGALNTAASIPQLQTLLEVLQLIAAMPGMPAQLMTCNAMEVIHSASHTECAAVRATCKTIEALLLAAPYPQPPSQHLVR